MMNKLIVSALAAAALIVVPNAKAQEPVELAWKFAKGQKITIEMSQEMNIAMDILGRKNESKTTTKSWMSWETTDFSDDVAKVQSVIDRMTVDVTSAAMSAKYDTDLADDAPGQSPQMGAMLKSIIGEKMMQTMQTNGKITSVEVPDALKKVMGASGGEMIESLSRNSSLEFPAKPLSVGDSWKVEFTTPSPVGKMEMVNTYSYGGVNKANPDLHEINVSSKMQFIKEPGNPVTITVGRQETKGTLLFDKKKGRLDSSSVKQDMEMLVETGGQKIKQSLKSDSAVTFK